MREIRICGFWRLRLVLVRGSLLSHRNNAMSPNAEHHGLIPLPYNIKAVVLYIDSAVLYKTRGLLIKPVVVPQGKKKRPRRALRGIALYRGLTRE
jgi:hypothetical protein